MKNKEVLIVWVVGNRNRGKSLVLSKLSNVSLPDGTSIKTEGISIKYPQMEEGKDAKYILMDSAWIWELFIRNLWIYEWSKYAKRWCFKNVEINCFR